jgi:hypothetical protein
VAEHIAHMRALGYRYDTNEETLLYPTAYATRDAGGRLDRD